MDEINSKKRHLSPTIAWYMTGNFLLPLVCSLLGFTALFLLNNFFDEISDFASSAIPVKLLITYFLALQPQNLTNVISISVLLAASFMTLMMGRHNELTAIRAAGLSLFKSAFPVWIIAALASFLVFAINESWGPASSQYAKRIEERYTSGSKKRQAVAFHHPTAHRDWSINSLEFDSSEKNQMKKNLAQRGAVAHEVVLRQYDKDGRTPLWLIMAKELRFQPESNTWIFKNGMFQQNKGTPEFFQQKELPLPETPASIVSHSRNWEMATIRQLLPIIHGGIITSKRTLCELRTLVWHRIFFPLAPLVGALFGVALTVSTDRMGLMRGFAMAILCLAGYYLVGELFLVLGKNGWVPPFVAGALPSLLFLTGAVMTMLRKQ